MCGWQVKLCDPSLTRAIPERIWGVSRRCAIQIDIYFTLLTNHDSLSRRSLQQHRGHGRSRHVQAYFPMVSTPVIYVVNSCLYSDIGFLGHIACIARMRPIATNVAHSAVCLSVCLSVCLCVYWSHKCAPQKRLNRSTSRLTRVGPRSHVLDGFEIPLGKGQFWGVVRPTESIGSFCYGLWSERNHSIVDNGSRLQCSSLVGVGLHCVKNIRCDL